MRNRAFKQGESADNTRDRRMLKIGELSRQTGIGIETLRFYERSGLLDKPARTYSGYRMYSAYVLERLKFIKQAQVLGFSLEEIKKLINDARGGHSPCEEVRQIVRVRLEELDQRMREMARYAVRSSPCCSKTMCLLGKPRLLPILEMISSFIGSEVIIHSSDYFSCHILVEASLRLHHRRLMLRYSPVVFSVMVTSLLFRLRQNQP